MLLNLGILSFLYYISMICFTDTFFPYFIKGSVALILFWHTKADSSGNFHHPDQNDAEEHAQFNSRSWQSHTLIPLLWSWCRDTQAAEPSPLEASHSALLNLLFWSRPDTMYHKCAQLQSPKSWGAGSSSSPTLPWQQQQTVLGAAPPLPVQARWVAHSCRMARPPGSASKPDAKLLDDSKVDRWSLPGLSGSSTATPESDHVLLKSKEAF